MENFLIYAERKSEVHLSVKGSILTYKDILYAA
jgi:hypothetical protein